MATKKPRRKSVKAAKTEESPKFLLEEENGGTATNVMTLAQDESSTGDSDASEPPSSDDVNDIDFDDTDEADWPERDDIRDGLIGHVRKRFGIDPDVAERAINDILRIA